MEDLIADNLDHFINGKTLYYYVCNSNRSVTKFPKSTKFH